MKPTMSFKIACKRKIFDILFTCREMNCQCQLDLHMDATLEQYQTGNSLILLVSKKKMWKEKIFFR